MELWVLFGAPLVVGFLAGYALRAYQSKRRRTLARQYFLWQMPPKQSWVLIWGMQTPPTCSNSTTGSGEHPAAGEDAR